MKFLSGGDLGVTGEAVPRIGEVARALFAKSDLVCFNFEAPHGESGEPSLAPNSLLPSSLAGRVVQRARAAYRALAGP